MKGSYNLVKSCLLFILFISFSIIIISAESNLYITPNTTIYTNFTYTENTQNTTFPQSQPYAIDIQSYDDGTTLIHLVRNNNTANCFEPILRIRIIHLNGSVTEINTDLNLDSVNYCLFNDTLTGKMENPISIRPLKQPFILVSYMKINDPDYKIWGTVLNWNGEKLSSILLKSIPKEGLAMKSLIEININKELFLYVNIHENLMDAGQYSVDVNGNLSELGYSRQEIDRLPTSYTLFTSLATVDEDRNKISLRNSILLFPITVPGMKINAVHCNTFWGFCYYCIASTIIYNNKVHYEKVHFCTEKFLTSYPIQIPNEIGVLRNVLSTPIGGYILSAVNDTTCFMHISEYFNSNSGADLTYFNTTGVSAYGILKHNNTHLLSLRDTNSKNISWSLLTVQVPKFQGISGYYNYGNMVIANVTPSINFNVDSSTTNISISFAISVDLSKGNITIYKVSDHSIRQSVSVTSEFCKLSNNSRVVNISIIDSTFNEYGEKYYVKVDHNFAKANASLDNEPLRGIESGVWILKSKIAATGLAVLTIDASRKFLTLSRNNQSEYFDTLLDELAHKVPVRRERLSSDKKFQYFDEFGQIAISIRIDLPTNETENTVPGVFSNLNNRILYKGITTFHTGMTNDLNSTLGFQPHEGPWDKFKLQIIAVIAIFVICLFYHISSYKLHSKKFEAISSAILRLGLIIPNFILSILFIVYNSNDIQELHLPSASILANLKFKEWVKYKQELVAIFTILATTDYEYLIILKDVPIFNKVAIDYKYLTIIKDVTKAEIDEYLKILEDVPISDEFNKSDKIKQIDILKALKDTSKTTHISCKLNEMMKEKYKIYGITRDETEQYMIVLDYYFNKRDIKKYGECKECKRPNTNPEWCQSCDPS
ncbi:12748_t:CDS:10, partial [Cetraspora pellucida]